MIVRIIMVKMIITKTVRIMIAIIVNVVRIRIMTLIKEFIQNKSLFSTYKQKLTWRRRLLLPRLELIVYLWFSSFTRILQQTVTTELTSHPL